MYPGARIYEDDTQQPWNPGSVWKPSEPGTHNPDLIFSLQDNDNIPGYTNQDRPFAMAAAENYQQLFVGTVPKNGMLGGALATWNTTTRQQPEVYWNIVPDQSVVSLVWEDNFVYGGTSVYGGMGITPKASEAKLFVWDVEQKELVHSLVPAPGKPAITQLHVGPDNNIWGLAGGVIFIFDPETQKVIYRKDEFTEIAGRYGDGSLITGRDGNIYGTIGNQLFRIQPESKVLTVLATGAQKVAQDNQGRLYTYGDPITELHQLSIEALPEVK